MIDADLFKQSLESVLEKMDLAGESQVDIADGVKRALRLLEIQPEVDAAPVVHGRWIEDDFPEKDLIMKATGLIGIICSECGAPQTLPSEWSGYINGHDVYVYKFCPQCGAKMDMGRI